MAGSIFPDIDPNTTSGTDLSNILNDFKDGVASTFKAATRPSNIQAGMLWVDETDEIGLGKLILQLYDGTKDVEVLRVDKNTEAITVGSIGDLLKILKVSDDLAPAVLELVKKRATGDQTQSGDEVGEIRFTGITDLAVEEIMAVIDVVSRDNVTSTTHGADLIFSTTPQGSAALAEYMRLMASGNLGIGTTTATEKLHVSGLDATTVKVENIADNAIPSRVKLAKKRIAGGGQTLNGDILGEVLFEGVESGSGIVDIAKVVVTATEDTDTGSHGSKMSFWTKAIGSDTYVEQLAMDDSGVTLPGTIQNDIDVSENLLHGGVTQDLFTIDSATYGSFTAEIFMTGISTLTRSMKWNIEGVWDGTNWHTQFEKVDLQGNGDVATITITDAAILDVDYDNVLNLGNFVSGRIYKKIRRNLI